MIVVVVLAVAAGVGLWLWPMPHGAGVPVFTAAWLLMTVATMLPTTAPLLRAFATITAARSRRGFLTAAVVLGFLGVWTAAGVGAGLVDLAVARVVHLPAVHGQIGLLLAATLLLAGAYQLSGLADRCLRRCRAPMGILGRHWTGRVDVVRQSLRVGADYGRSCLGCCAPLMTVMLVVGMANLLWMYLLALVGLAQKVLPWGRTLASVVGGALIASGGMVAVVHIAGGALA